MASAPTRVWRVQSYSEQENTVWPKEGRHVLAQYDDDTVVVYQAYCPEIADYAVKHQKCVRVTARRCGRVAWFPDPRLYRKGLACKTRLPYLVSRKPHRAKTHPQGGIMDNRATNTLLSMGGIYKLFTQIIYP